MSNGLLTVSEVSKMLGYSVQHTRLLIRQQKLPGKKIGRDWVVEADQLVRSRRAAEKR